MADIVQIRRDTAANWTSANPTLANGEQGYETDTKKMKVGDGSTAWTSLAYFAGGAGSSTWTGLTDTPASITSLHLVRGNSVGDKLEQIAQSTLLLDDFGTPENNADLNATTGHHGLLPTLGGGTTNYLRADGNWAEPSGTGSGLPVVDTTSIATGSVDATKQMRFEVDGLTTSTTRVLTVQDKDVTICDNADLTTHTGGANPHSGSAASGANSDITSLSGLTTDLSISQGGTGQSTAQAAIDALSQVSGATNEHVLTKDTGTGSATWKAASGGGVTDHGALTGLDDDDHTQYLLADGTRAMTGNLAIGGNAINDAYYIDMHTIGPYDRLWVRTADASSNAMLIQLYSGSFFFDMYGSLNLNTNSLSGVTRITGPNDADFEMYGGNSAGDGSIPVIEWDRTNQTILAPHDFNLGMSGISEIINPLVGTDAANHHYVINSDIDGGTF